MYLIKTHLNNVFRDSQLYVTFDSQLYVTLIPPKILYTPSRYILLDVIFIIVIGDALQLYNKTSSLYFCNKLMIGHLHQFVNQKVYTKSETAKTIPNSDVNADTHTRARAQHMCYTCSLYM